MRRGFRKDLFYRLSVLPLQLPPLRDRGLDVQLLLRHIQDNMRASFILSPEALRVLLSYQREGNVRELRNRMGEVDLTKPVYVTCQVGLRGHVACRMLAQNGAKVYNLSGGYALYSAYAKDLQGLADGGNKNCTACGRQV